MTSDSRDQRVATLRAAYRQRRLTVERTPRERSGRRAASTVTLDANAVADAMLHTFAQRGWSVP